MTAKTLANAPADENAAQSGSTGPHQQAIPNIVDAHIFFALATAVLLGFILYVGRGVLIPFLFAAFLSFLIFTLKELVDRTPGLGRYLPSWISYTFSFLIIGSAIAFLVLIVKSNIDVLIDRWPSYQVKLESIVRSLVTWLRSRDSVPVEMIGGIERLQNAALSIASTTFRNVLGSIRSVSSNIFTLVTIFIYTAFLLIERGRIFKKISLISTDHGRQAAVSETINEISDLIRQYLTVKTLTNLITAILSYTIMRVFGVDFAGFWALLIFVFNYIPIFGAATAITLPVLLMLVQPDGGGLRPALFLLATMVGVEQLISSVIEPRLVGKTLNLSPVVILFSLALWGSLWGFAGLLLSVPITVMSMIIMTQFQITRPIAILFSDNGEIAPIREHDDERLALDQGASETD